ncbi:MAG: phage integrase N-terminal SAM-like domain-containing protein [Bacteroidales bacterium]
MATSVQSSGLRAQLHYPDGRQTRIDFFNSSKSGRRDGDYLQNRRSPFEWWHALTGWLTTSTHEQERQLEEFQKFLESRSYSPKSCHSYTFMLKKFFQYLDEKRISQISLGVIEDYNYDFFVIGRYSRSYQLQFINGLSLYLYFAYGVKANLKGLRKSKARR